MGRVFKRKYKVKGPDGQPVEQLTRAWYIEYTDARGRTRRRKIGPNKDQARQALMKMEVAVAGEKAGLPGVSAREIRLDKLLADYLRERERHVTADHVKGVRHRIGLIVDRAGLLFVDDVRPEAVEAVLDELEDQGLSARTVNTYLQAVKGALTWAVRRRLIPYNPLDAVRARSERHKVRKRRPLSTDECRRLLQAALSGPVQRLARIPGSEKRSHEDHVKAREMGSRNCLIYRMLLATGLRLDELRALTWSDVDLNDRRIYCRESWTKNARNATLPMGAEIRESLKEWKKVTQAGPGDRVVKVPTSILRTFDRDIEAAGIAKRDAAGRTVDLHSLRHTFGQRLNDAGADPKVLQGLLRHSTPTVSLGLYVHRDVGRMAAALDDLDSISPEDEAESEEKSAENVATGTDGPATCVSENSAPSVQGRAEKCSSTQRIPPNSRPETQGRSSKGETGQALTRVERNAFQAGDTGSNPVGTTTAESHDSDPNPRSAREFAGDTPISEQPPECTGVQEGAAGVGSPRPGTAQSILDLYDRFQHLDSLFEDCSSFEGPIYKMAAEMWAAIKSFVIDSRKDG